MARRNVDKIFQQHNLIRYGITQSPICQAFSGSLFPVVLRGFLRAAGEMGPLRFNFLAVRTPTWHATIQSRRSLLELWGKSNRPWVLLKIRQERITSPRVDRRSWYIVASGTTSAGHSITIARRQWLSW